MQTREAQSFNSREAPGAHRLRQNLLKWYPRSTHKSHPHGRNKAGSHIRAHNPRSPDSQATWTHVHTPPQAFMSKQAHRHTHVSTKTLPGVHTHTHAPTSGTSWQDEALARWSTPREVQLPAPPGKPVFSCNLNYLFKDSTKCSHRLCCVWQRQLPPHLS